MRTILIPALGRSVKVGQSSQIIPRIETIRANQPNVSPSYRLVISRPQDIVFVSCPSNYAPKLGYL